MVYIVSVISSKAFLFFSFTGQSGAICPIGTMTMGSETRVGEGFFQLRNIEVAHPTTAQSTFSSSQTEMLCGYGYINFSMLFSVLLPCPAMFSIAKTDDI